MENEAQTKADQARAMVREDPCVCFPEAALYNDLGIVKCQNCDHPIWGKRYNDFINYNTPSHD